MSRVQGTRRGGRNKFRMFVFVVCLGAASLYYSLLAGGASSTASSLSSSSASMSLEERVKQIEREMKELAAQVTSTSKPTATTTTTSTTTTTTTATTTTTPTPTSAPDPAAAVSTFKQTVVIPTACIPYQKFQQVVAVMSLRRMQERHPHLKTQFDVTRLISCGDPEINAKWFPDERMSSLYIAPDYTAKVGRPEALTLNKPGALWHWISKGPGRLLPDEHELVIVDADFLFLNAAIPYPMSELGAPAAAHFQLGPFYKKPEVMKYCEGQCSHYNHTWLFKHEVGPPIAIRKRDAVPILREWYRITKAMMEEGDKKKAYDWPGDWMADMYAYMFAAEISKLPHKQVWGWFLVNQFEKWHTIKDLTVSWCFHYAGNYKLSNEVKREAVKPMDNVGELVIPSVANTSEPGEIWWHKHQYKSAKTVDMMLSCDASESQRMWSQADRGAHRFEPPAWLRREEAPTEHLWHQQADVHRPARMKWIMYTLYHGINDAFERYRRIYC